MKIDEIFEHWNKDSIINQTELTQFSIGVPKLHNKYLRIYSKEKLILKKLKLEYKELYKVKHQYYDGSIDEEELIQRGWKPNPLKIIKDRIPMYIDADKDVIDLTLKISIQEEKVETLDSILKMIMNMNWNIRNAIEHEKFINGIL